MTPTATHLPPAQAVTLALWVAALSVVVMMMGIILVLTVLFTLGTHT